MQQILLCSTKCNQILPRLQCNKTSACADGTKNNNDHAYTSLYHPALTLLKCLVKPVVFTMHSSNQCHNSTVHMPRRDSRSNFYAATAAVAAACSTNALPGLLVFWKAMPLMPSGLATNPNLLYKPTTLGSAYRETIVMSSSTNRAVNRSTRPRPRPLRCHAGFTCRRLQQLNDMHPTPPFAWQAGLFQSACCSCPCYHLAVRNANKLLVTGRQHQQLIA